MYVFKVCCRREQSTMKAQLSDVSKWVLNPYSESICIEKSVSLTMRKMFLLSSNFLLNRQQIWNALLSVTVSCRPVVTTACDPCSCVWCVTVFRFWLWATTPSRREIIWSTWDFEMYSGYRWAGKGLTLIYVPLSFPRLLFPNLSLHPGWPMTLAWMSLKMTTCRRLRRSQTSAGWAWTAMAQI